MKKLIVAVALLCFSVFVHAETYVCSFTSMDYQGIRSYSFLHTLSRVSEGFTEVIRVNHSAPTGAGTEFTEPAHSSPETLNWEIHAETEDFLILSMSYEDIQEIMIINKISGTFIIENERLTGDLAVQNKFVEEDNYSGLRLKRGFGDCVEV